MNKKQLRHELQSRLLELTDQQRCEKSKKAYQNLIGTGEFQKAAVIMIYLSLPHEVDTSGVILHAWQQDKIVVVPKVSWQQRHMIPVEINSLETGFSSEVNGLQNPVTGVPIPLEDIDVVITPALGFDKNGNRLGRGGSYYDRFFANKELAAPRCGFAFTEQIVESIPVSDHDQPMNLLVTDEEVIYFNNILQGR